jgi:hypothetical protein
MAKYDKDHEAFVQVRLRRATADRLRAFAVRLAEHARNTPGTQPAFIEDNADKLSMDLAVLTLLWRDDLHAMRSRQKRRNTGLVEGPGLG